MNKKFHKQIQIITIAIWIVYGLYSMLRGAPHSLLSLFLYFIFPGVIIPFLVLMLLYIADRMIITFGIVPIRFVSPILSKILLDIEYYFFFFFLVWSIIKTSNSILSLLYSFKL